MKDLYLVFRWTYLLLQTLGYFLNRGKLENYWDEIKWTVVIFQNAAILEVRIYCLIFDLVYSVINQCNINK